MNTGFRTGVIAVVGRPNVGKSTLVNALVGAKVSIVSSKPQTTRHRILGVRTEADAQYIFADTPGFQTQYRNKLNQAMNRAVTQALAEVDVVLWLVEAMKFTPADQDVIPLLPRDKPVILVVNKVDTVADRNALLPYLQSVAGQFNFRRNRPPLRREGQGCRPPAGHPQALSAGRRALVRRGRRHRPLRPLPGRRNHPGEGVPPDRRRDPLCRRGHRRKFEEEGDLSRIGAVIWVERDGHKPILLGKGGEHIKRIASEARQDMEKLFGAQGVPQPLGQGQGRLG